MKYLDNSSLKINKYRNITPFGHVQRLFAHLCGRQNLTLSDVCQLYLPQQRVKRTWPKGVIVMYGLSPKCKVVMVKPR